MSGKRPYRPPYVYRLIRDASGQSETFGVILLLGITVVGTTAIVTFGSQALSQTKSAASFQRTEHTMTLLDSRSAMVALGESEMQRVQFAGGGGKFRVNESAGWIKIKHNNFSKNENGDEVIYNRTLGTFLYKNDDTIIAYQGGGVWRIDGDGDARMISQPEFHYRGATLTLPIIRVRGSGTAVGQTTVTVESPDEETRIFPNTTLDSPGGPNPLDNETGAPYNNSSVSNPAGTRKDAKQYANPIDTGNVTILIHSRFYEGWADFFRERTTSEVFVHDDNNTVRIRLKTLSDPGFFGNIADDIKVRGMSSSDHTVTNFTVNLTEGKNGGGAFKSMHWSFYAESGSKKLELHVSTNGNDCEDVRDGTDPIRVTIWYENGTGDDQSQEWTGLVESDDGDFIKKVNCGSGGPGNVDESMVINWTAGLQGTATDPVELDYDEITANSCGNSKWHWADDYASCSSHGLGTAPMNQHDVDDWTGHDCCPFRPGSGHEANTSFLVRHYMALLAPNFDIKGDEGPGASNRILEDKSSGSLEFKQEGGQFITYLHVTENRVKFGII